MQVILAAFCVVTAIFLGGQAVEFGWRQLVPAVAELRCGIVNRTLKSRNIPVYLKDHERGIRYRTGCFE
jgi:hypothetical protein